MPGLDKFKFCAQFEFASQAGRVLSSESNTTIQELSSIYPAQTTKHYSRKQVSKVQMLQKQFF